MSSDGTHSTEINWIECPPAAGGAGELEAIPPAPAVTTEPARRKSRSRSGTTLPAVSWMHSLRDRWSGLDQTTRRHATVAAAACLLFGGLGTLSLMSGASSEPGEAASDEVVAFPGPGMGDPLSPSCWQKTESGESTTASPAWPVSNAARPASEEIVMGSAEIPEVSAENAHWLHAADEGARHAIHFEAVGQQRVGMEVEPTAYSAYGTTGRQPAWLSGTIEADIDIPLQQRPE